MDFTPPNSITHLEHETRNVFWSFPAWMLPFTFTVLLTVGGWIFKIGQSSSRFDADELRITTLESIIVDKTIMAEKEKAQAMHNADVERRLERIEIKVDDLLTKEGRGHPR